MNTLIHFRIAGRDRALCGAIKNGTSDRSRTITCPRCRVARVEPCDDENGRTWDVRQLDATVASCFATRADARAYAKALNAEPFVSFDEAMGARAANARRGP